MLSLLVDFLKWDFRSYFLAHILNLLSQLFLMLHNADRPNITLNKMKFLWC